MRIRFSSHSARNMWYHHFNHKYNATCFMTGNKFHVSLKNTKVVINVPEFKLDPISAKVFIEKEMKAKYSSFLI